MEYGARSSNSVKDTALVFERQRPRNRVLQMLRTAPIFPSVILLLMIVAAIFAPFMSPHDPAAIDLELKLMPPFWQEGGTSAYLLGTDSLGRDVLSRLIWGARVSVIVGLLAIVFAGALGSVLGMVAAYFGGKVDAIIMRIADIQMSVPALVLALILSAVLMPGLKTVIIVIGIVYWTWYARIIRGEVLSIKERDFIALAKVAGCSRIRILFAHILPNIVNTLIVLSTLQLGSVIIYEASLSFMGLGVQPPSTSWGLMLSDGRGYMTVAWWLMTFPGIAIMLVVLASNLLGDWLRDLLDPKRRQFKL